MAIIMIINQTARSYFSRSIMYFFAQIAETNSPTQHTVVIPLPLGFNTQDPSSYLMYQNMQSRWKCREIDCRITAYILWSKIFGMLFQS